MPPYKHPHLTGKEREKAIMDAARCRATRAHRMDPVPAPAGAPRPKFGALITYRCELCGTLRFDVVQRRSGELLYRTYDYPSWYEQANEERETPSWWRATWWSSLPDDLFLEPDVVVPIKRKRRSA